MSISGKQDLRLLFGLKGIKTTSKDAWDTFTSKDA